MSLAPLSLQELQNWVRWIVTDPRGVEGALSGSPTPRIDSRDAARYESPTPAGLPWIVDNVAPPPVLDRLSIYAEGYFSRILESLETDYSRLRALLGADEFQKLVADFLKRYPSRTPNLGEVGSALPEFVAEYLPSRPELRAVADLEWAAIEVFYADDGRSIDPSELLQVAETDWPRAAITLRRAVRVLKSPWQLDLLWSKKGHEGVTDAEAAALAEEASWMISCFEGTVHVRRMSHCEACAIDGFAAGHSLEKVLGDLRFQAGPDLNEEEVGVLLQAAFAAWVNSRVIASLHVSEVK